MRRHYKQAHQGHEQKGGTTGGLGELSLASANLVPVQLPSIEQLAKMTESGSG